MCGRGCCTLRPDDFPRACHINDRPVRTVHMDRYRPAFNVSPGSNFPVVRREDGPIGEGVVLHCMKWGLIPSFTEKTAKPNHYKMFNARSGSINEKPSFRRLVPNNRCLVAVDGFYEWKKDGSKKQPYYIHLKDGRPLVFAALYDSWKSSEDRMPVILGDKGSTDTWLNGSSSSRFDTVLKLYEELDLVWYPVTPAMGKPSFDGPECIKEIQLKTEEKNLISKFFSTKGVKNEQESSPQVKSPLDEPVKTNLPKSLKEESETDDNTEHPSFTEKGDNDSKSNVSVLPHEGDVKCHTKRDYEKFSADSRPTTDKIEKLCTSPVRKKGSVNSAGDRQPTLFSYF